MLDYLHNAGYSKTYNEFREEAPEMVGPYTICASSGNTDHRISSSTISLLTLHLQRVGC